MPSKRQECSKTKQESFQVLDLVTGKRSSNLNFLNKRQFRRPPWILRLVPKARRKRPDVMNTQERQATIQQVVDALQKVDNPTSYQQVLEPIFEILETKCQTRQQEEQLHLFQNVLSSLVTTSAMFLQHSRQNEPLLPDPKDHYRALTNYWVYLILDQIYYENANTPPTLCRNVYAYSFIYPYSDDLLDGHEMNIQQKQQFCKNIESILLGKRKVDQYAFTQDDSFSNNARQCEERVYVLLNQMLQDDNTNVRESCRVINQAQVASLKQHVDDETMQAAKAGKLSKQFVEEIFDISITKGVASVMPNAYFLFSHHKILSKEQAQVAVLIGTMGQFINDIEGLFDDYAASSLTPALISYLKHGSLDVFMTKCLTYLKLQLRQDYPSLSQERVELLVNLIQLRLLTAVALLHEENPQQNVLSHKFIRGLEQEFGMEVSMFALVGRLERLVFGNVESSGEACAHQLESPEQFRAFALKQAQDLLV